MEKVILNQNNEVIWQETISTETQATRFIAEVFTAIVNKKLRQAKYITKIVDTYNYEGSLDIKIYFDNKTKTIYKGIPANCGLVNSDRINNAMKGGE